MEDMDIAKLVFYLDYNDVNFFGYIRLLRLNYAWKVCSDG